MASAEHQKLLNELAKALEGKDIEITHLDIDGMPEHFEPKYRNLPTPSERDGHIPDLEGFGANIKHLGEVKTDIVGDNNMDSQLKVFSNRVINNVPVPFHIAVPKMLENDLRQKIAELGLRDKLDKNQITIWLA